MGFLLLYVECLSSGFKGARSGVKFRGSLVSVGFIVVEIFQK